MRMSVVLEPGKPIRFVSGIYREAWTEETKDANGEVKVINHRKARQSKVYHAGNTVDLRKDVVVPMTPLATAYMYHIMPSLVYTAIKNRLAYNGHEMMFNLLIQLVNYANASDEMINDYEAYLDKEYTKNVKVCSDTEYEQIVELKPSIMEVIEHNYKYVKNGNRRYKVELEHAEKELTLTEYGRELFREAKTVQAYNVDILDLLGDCYAVYVELYNNGLLKKPADVFNYRYAFYRAVNNYINKENRSPVPYLDRMQMNMSGEYDENGKEIQAYEESIVAGKNIDKSIENVVTLDAIASAISLIVDNANSRINKAMFAKVLTMYIFYGHTYASIANFLDIHVNQVSRYIGYAKQIANMPNIKSKILD